MSAFVPVMADASAGGTGAVAAAAESAYAAVFGIRRDIRAARRAAFFALRANRLAISPSAVLAACPGPGAGRSIGRAAFHLLQHALEPIIRQAVAVIVLAVADLGAGDHALASVVHRAVGILPAALAAFAAGSFHAEGLGVLM